MNGRVNRLKQIDTSIIFLKKKSLYIFNISKTQKKDNIHLRAWNKPKQNFFLSILICITLLSRVMSQMDYRPGQCQLKHVINLFIFLTSRLVVSKYLYLRSLYCPLVSCFLINKKNTIPCMLCAPEVTLHFTGYLHAQPRKGPFPSLRSVVQNGRHKWVKNSHFSPSIRL